MCPIPNLHAHQWCTIFCELCDYVGKTKQAMNWHRYEKHSIKHAVRRYLHDTVCECCMRDFMSRERIFTHVSASSPKCNMFYRRVGSELCNDRYEKLESGSYENTMRLMRQDRRRTCADQPHARVYGPLHPVADELGVRFDCLLIRPPQRQQGDGDMP